MSGLIGGDVEQLQLLGDNLQLKQGNIDEIITAVQTRARQHACGRARPTTASRTTGTRRSRRRWAG